MKELTYTISFFSEWHAGSGLSSGSDLDALVIKDNKGFPFIPGKTLKGLLREAAEELSMLKGIKPADNPFIIHFFGFFDELNSEESKIHQRGKAHFSDAMLSSKLRSEGAAFAKFFFREKTSTAIEKTGLAVKNSLRKMETTIPCQLSARIFYDEYPGCEDELKKYFQWIKRLGQSRNHGLGRCEFLCTEIKEASI